MIVSPPIGNAEYPINLFRAISDIPPNPAPIINNIVTSSYDIMIFETWEILTTDVRNLLFSVSALYLRFNNEPLVFSSASSKLNMRFVIINILGNLMSIVTNVRCT